MRCAVGDRSSFEPERGGDRRPRPEHGQHRAQRFGGGDGALDDRRIQRFSPQAVDESIAVRTVGCSLRRSARASTLSASTSARIFR